MSSGMSFSLDARIPVLFGSPNDAGPRDALLIEGEGTPARGRDWFQPDAPSAHPLGCPCCLPRNSAGMALTRLMLARGRSTGLFFTRVIAVASSDAGRASIKAALTQDPIASGFYRPINPNQPVQTED